MGGSCIHFKHVRFAWVLLTSYVAAEFKEILSNSKNLTYKPETHKLIFKGKELVVDDMTLEQYGIVEGSAIHLLVKRTEAGTSSNAAQYTQHMDQQEAFLAQMMDNPMVQQMMENTDLMQMMMNSMYHKILFSVFVPLFLIPYQFSLFFFVLIFHRQSTITNNAPKQPRT